MNHSSFKEAEKEAEASPGTRRVGTILLFCGTDVVASPPQPAKKIMEKEKGCCLTSVNELRRHECPTETAIASLPPAPPGTERRYVYVSDDKLKGEPYYLCRSGNAVLVVDPTRIDFFPGRMEPPEPVQTYAQRQREAEEREAAERAAAERASSAHLAAAARDGEEAAAGDGGKEVDSVNIIERDDVMQLGSIVVQVGIDEDEDDLTHFKSKFVNVSKKFERREVYCSRRTRYAPYYFTKTFNRVIVVDRNRIDFIEGAEEQRSVKLQALKAQERAVEEEKEKLAREAKEREEKARMDLLGPGEDDIKVGTIVVQRKLKPGERVTQEKQVLDVYRRRRIGGGAGRRGAPPPQNLRKVEEEEGEKMVEEESAAAAAAAPSAAEEEEELEGEPYMVATTGKRIYVRDVRSIRYLKADRVALAALLTASNPSPSSSS